MTNFTIFLVLITIVCFLLIIVIMVQNPKGGGLSGNIAGFSNQFMGVKQTTDVLEKGTWIFAGVIGVLCLVSTLFISGGSSSSNGASNKISTTPVQTAPPANSSGLSTNPNLQPQGNPTTTAQKPAN